MYLNLYMALKREGVPLEKLQERLNLNLDTFQKKMKGELDWTYGEMKKIEEILPDYSISWLYLEDSNEQR